MKKAYSYTMRRYMYAAFVTALLLAFSSGIMFYYKHFIIAAALGITAVCAIVFVVATNARQKDSVSRYIDKIIESGDSNISVDLLSSLPEPVVVCGIDGTVRWYNDLFLDVIKGVKPELEALEDLIPELKWSEVLKCPGGRIVNAVIDGKTYSANWRMIKETETGTKVRERYSVFVFLKDISYVKTLEEAYKNERVDVAVINIDNLDDFSQKADDDIIETATSRLRSVISAWAKEGRAVLKRMERDRYFVVFEHKELSRYISDNFSVVEKVRSIAEEFKFPLALSIGIGTGGTLTENEVSARNALDLALGRGGGQVCVKDNTQFKFYGGKSGEYERSTRVKARAVAVALRDFIANSDNVIFMGHKAPDYDCFGSAMGLQRAVRELGKTPYIVHERVSPAVEKMYLAIKDEPEYEGMFVDELEVLDKVTENTLLVVLDTHRPSMLPCPKLLDNINKVVLIDHHRRSTEFISPCSLVYHEPYASSTCEMATELIEYMGIGNSITKNEAHCLYTGILMDTKHFMLKTGVRTFEAASYLRRLGLNTVSVRRMFCTTREDYSIKSQIVNDANMAADRIAVSKTYKIYDNMRMVASLAADEMLNIDNIGASVVVYPAEGGVGFCARSIGDTNVQLIMEKLGGGGHMTVAGAYIKDISIDEGEKRACAAIKEYLEDIK